MTHNLGNTELKRLHREWRRRTDERLALLLDGVQNPYNLGSILRSAAAYGVDHLWLVGSPSPNDAKVQKTALGSQRFLKWTRCETSDEALTGARSDGYRIIGIELADGATPLHATPLDGDVCLAVGHEDRGLSKEVLRGADVLAFLPQIGKIGSLNVAQAATVAMWEARRAEWATESD